MELLNDNSTFEQIFNVLVETNILKIKQIKSKMNTLIEHKKYQQKYNDLEPFLDYTLYMLVKSYPILNKYIDNIIKILLIINRYLIHPSIYQLLFSNIIFSIYITEIKLNKELLKDKLIIESISSIYNEVEILLSIFNDIFQSVDTEYLVIEEKLYYNYISGLTNIEFLEYSEKIDYTHTDLISKIKILNIFLIEIDHLTQIEFNDFISKNFSSDISTLNDNILNQFLNVFNNITLANYNYNIKYEKYNKINLIDILIYQEKNSIYYWIDKIAIINSKILNELINTNDETS